MEKTTKKIVMYGDSIIDWFSIAPYENHGHAGYKTRDVLWMLEDGPEIYGDICILLVGVNDILCQFSIDMTVKYYMKIIDILHGRYKEVICILLLPTDDDKINNKANEINNFIRQIKNIKILDIVDKFCNENKKILPKYTTDGVHLSNMGYNLLLSEIKKILDQR